MDNAFAEARPQTTIADALVPTHQSREARQRRASMLVYNNIICTHTHAVKAPCSQTCTKECSIITMSSHVANFGRYRKSMHFMLKLVLYS